LQAVVDKVAAEQRRRNELLQQIESGGRATALDIQAVLLGKDMTAEQVVKSATRLAERHNQHLIAADFVRSVLLAREKGSRQETEKFLSRFRHRAATDGFFIMRYDVQGEAERVLSPQYVIGEASGRHPSSSSSFNNVSVKAADCQCELPLASADAAHVIELPDPSKSDVIANPALLTQILAKPWSVGEVKDITTMLGMGDLRLAGAARTAAFDEIRENINPTRGEFPVEGMVGCIAQLKGIVTPEGEVVRLQEDLQHPPIMNDRSLIAHLNSSYEAHVIYSLADRTVAVTVDGKEYQLLVTWWVVHQKLERTKAEQESE